MTLIELKDKADNLRRQIVTSAVWKSIFRHGYKDTGRNRILMTAANVFLHLHPSKVRRHSIKINYTWCAGGITFLFFIILTVTGIILMFYYRPVAEYAYVDMKYLQFDVPFGMVMRNMHRWAAHLMVMMVMFHMFRVFLTGSYKPPREFNWIIGVILLVLTFMLSFTGYLLPWDQLSIWAVTVGTNMARATPMAGHEGPLAEQMQALTGVITPRYDARSVLLGGTIVGAPTLLRFYVLHCIFIPVATAVLIIVHFWRVRKDGGISGPL